MFKLKLLDIHMFYVIHCQCQENGIRRKECKYCSTVYVHGHVENSEKVQDFTFIILIEGQKFYSLVNFAMNVNGLGYILGDPTMHFYIVLRHIPVFFHTLIY